MHIASGTRGCNCIHKRVEGPIETSEFAYNGHIYPFLRQCRVTKVINSLRETYMELLQEGKVAVQILEKQG
jgi:hypothetical protein